MLLDRVLKDLELSLEAFAVCEVASGWRLQLDRLAWVTVHFVLAGNGRLRMPDGQAVAMPPRSLVLVPAGRAHSIETGGSVEHQVQAADAAPRLKGLKVFEAGPQHDADEFVVVCGRLQAKVGTGLGLFDRLEDALVVDFADSPHMASIFERLLEEERHRSDTSEAMMTALMSEAMILLFRRLSPDSACPLPWLTALEDPRLAAALALMVEHPESAHSVESLADASLMSRTAFTVAFSERFGQTPMAHLRTIRMRRAAGLLRRSDMTVDQVATRVGYASRSQFSRAFASELGASPAAFRREPRSP
jgi:AraC-like DNA-binding protein